jgi:hypothetical protein
MSFDEKAEICNNSVSLEIPSLVLDMFAGISKPSILEKFKPLANNINIPHITVFYCIELKI